jgi:hypothetical protein
MKKSLLFGLLAAAAAVLILSGCPTDPEIEYRDVPGETITNTVNVPGDPPPPELIHVDVAFGAEEVLSAALGEVAYKGKVIGVNGDITLTAPLEIPADYTVYILNGGALTTGDGSGLTVEGTLWVGYGGTLTSEVDSADPVVVTGNIKVVAGGNLVIDDIAAVENGSETTVLGTTKVVITGTLKHTGTLAAFSNVQAAWGAVTAGFLDLEEATIDDTKPSQIAGLTGINANKGLKASTAATAEDADTLIIPLGLDLTTTDVLDTVETLTVYGSLTADSATLKDGGVALTVGPKGEASIAAATLSTSTVNGTLALNGDLTLAAEAVLTIADPAKISGSHEIIAEDGTITIGGVAGFTTTNTGVTVTNLVGALTAFGSDYAALADTIELAGDFGASTESAIGTVLSEAATAAAVKNDVDSGNVGDAITITDGTTFVGTVNEPTLSGTDGDITGIITLSVVSGALKVADGGYDGDDPKYAILTFSGLQLQNSELITPAADAVSFSIGLKTARDDD